MTTLDEAPVNTRPTAARLLNEITEDAGRLAGQQVDLFKAEVCAAAGQLSMSAQLVGVGAALAGVGLVCLAAGLALLLHDLVPSLPAWACWLILAAVFFAVGGAVLYLGRARLACLTPLPKQSLAAFRENVSWIANRRTP
jgi:hypothetical protein